MTDPLKSSTTTGTTVAHPPAPKTQIQSKKTKKNEQTTIRGVQDSYLSAQTTPSNEATIGAKEDRLAPGSHRAISARLGAFALTTKQLQTLAEQSKIISPQNPARYALAQWSWLSSLAHACQQRGIEDVGDPLDISNERKDKLETQLARHFAESLSTAEQKKLESLEGIQQMLKQFITTGQGINQLPKSLHDTLRALDTELIKNNEKSLWAPYQKSADNILGKFYKKKEHRASAREALQAVYKKQHGPLTPKILTQQLQSRGDAWVLLQLMTQYNINHFTAGQLDAFAQAHPDCRPTVARWLTDAGISDVREQRNRAIRLHATATELEARVESEAEENSGWAKLRSGQWQLKWHGTGHQQKLTVVSDQPITDPQQKQKAEILAHEVRNLARSALQSFDQVLSGKLTPEAWLNESLLHLELKLKTTDIASLIFESHALQSSFYLFALDHARANTSPYIFKDHLQKIGLPAHVIQTQVARFERLLLVTSNVEPDLKKYFDQSFEVKIKLPADTNHECSPDENTFKLTGEARDLVTLAQIILVNATKIAPITRFGELNDQTRHLLEDMGWIQNNTLHITPGKLRELAVQSAANVILTHTSMAQLILNHPVVTTRPPEDANLDPAALVVTYLEEMGAGAIDPSPTNSTFLRLLNESQHWPTKPEIYERAAKRLHANPGAHVYAESFYQHSILTHAAVRSLVVSAGKLPEHDWQSTLKAIESTAQPTRKQIIHRRDITVFRGSIGQLAQENPIAAIRLVLAHAKSRGLKELAGKHWNKNIFDALPKNAVIHGTLTYEHLLQLYPMMISVQSKSPQENMDRLQAWSNVLAQLSPNADPPASISIVDLKPMHNTGLSEKLESDLNRVLRDIAALAQSIRGKTAPTSRAETRSFHSLSKYQSVYSFPNPWEKSREVMVEYLESWDLSAIDLTSWRQTVDALPRHTQASQLNPVNRMGLALDRLRERAKGIKKDASRFDTKWLDRLEETIQHWNNDFRKFSQHIQTALRSGDILQTPMGWVSKSQNPKVERDIKRFQAFHCHVANLVQRRHVLDNIGLLGRSKRVAAQAWAHLGVLPGFADHIALNQTDDWRVLAFKQNHQIALADPKKPNFEEKLYSIGPAFIRNLLKHPGAIGRSTSEAVIQGHGTPIPRHEAAMKILRDTLDEMERTGNTWTNLNRNEGDLSDHIAKTIVQHALQNLYGHSSLEGVRSRDVRPASQLAERFHMIDVKRKPQQLKAYLIGRKHPSADIEGGILGATLGPKTLGFAAKEAERIAKGHEASGNMDRAAQLKDIADKLKEQSELGNSINMNERSEATRALELLTDASASLERSYGDNGLYDFDSMLSNAPESITILRSANNTVSMGQVTLKSLKNRAGVSMSATEKAKDIWNDWSDSVHLSVDDAIEFGVGNHLLFEYGMHPMVQHEFSTVVTKNLKKSYDAYKLAETEDERRAALNHAESAVAQWVNLWAMMTAFMTPAGFAGDLWNDVRQGNLSAFAGKFPVFFPLMAHAFRNDVAWFSKVYNGLKQRLGRNQPAPMATHESVYIVEPPGAPRESFFRRSGGTVGTLLGRGVDAVFSPARTILELVAGQMKARKPGSGLPTVHDLVKSFGHIQLVNGSARLSIDSKLFVQLVDECAHHPQTFEASLQVLKKRGIVQSGREINLLRIQVMEYAQIALKHEGAEAVRSAAHAARGMHPIRSISFSLERRIQTFRNNAFKQVFAQLNPSKVASGLREELSREIAELIAKPDMRSKVQAELRNNPEQLARFLDQHWDHPEIKTWLKAHKVVSTKGLVNAINNGSALKATGLMAVLINEGLFEALDIEDPHLLKLFSVITMTSSANLVLTRWAAKHTPNFARAKSGAPGTAAKATTRAARAGKIIKGIGQGFSYGFVQGMITEHAATWAARWIAKQFGAELPESHWSVRMGRIGAFYAGAPLFSAAGKAGVRAASQLGWSTPAKISLGPVLSRVNWVLFAAEATALISSATNSDYESWENQLAAGLKSRELKHSKRWAAPVLSAIDSLEQVILPTARTQLFAHEGWAEVAHAEGVFQARQANDTAALSLLPALETAVPFEGDSIAFYQKIDLQEFQEAAMANVESMLAQGYAFYHERGMNLSKSASLNQALKALEEDSKKSPPPSNVRNRRAYVYCMAVKLFGDKKGYAHTAMVGSCLKFHSSGKITVKDPHSLAQHLLKQKIPGEAHETRLTAEQMLVRARRQNRIRQLAHGSQATHADAEAGLISEARSHAMRINQLQTRVGKATQSYERAAKLYQNELNLAMEIAASDPNDTAYREKLEAKLEAETAKRVGSADRAVVVAQETIIAGYTFLEARERLNHAIEQDKLPSDETYQAIAYLMRPATTQPDPGTPLQASDIKAFVLSKRLAQLERDKATANQALRKSFRAELTTLAKKGHDWEANMKHFNISNFVALGLTRVSIGSASRELKHALTELGQAQDHPTTEVHVTQAQTEELSDVPAKAQWLHGLLSTNPNEAIQYLENMPQPMALAILERFLEDAQLQKAWPRGLLGAFADAGDDDALVRAWQLVTWAKLSQSNSVDHADRDFMRDRVERSLEQGDDDFPGIGLPELRSASLEQRIQMAGMKTDDLYLNDKDKEFLRLLVDTCPAQEKTVFLEHLRQQGVDKNDL